MDATAGSVVTIGEAMVALYPEDHRPLAEARAYGSDVGGAEFNVATTLARLGVPTAWVSRLGADGLGERILRTADAAGVDTSAVEHDEYRPTGLYVKETTSSEDGVRTRMHYYRRDSAASALSPASLASGAAAELLRRASIVHTSGITAALSDTAADACARLREAVGTTAHVSVDLNLRPQLWRGRTTGALDALVAQADILFVGRDESELHFGHADPGLLFAAFPLLTTVVVKDDVRRASVHRRDGIETHVPCLTVDVVEPVGAGDAFAAGFLAGMASGCDDETCLRWGHALAALTLTSPGDRPLAVPTLDERARIAAADAAEWSGWRVGPAEVPWRVPA
jgi:2-dehydro-3-deoxygluconokinase